MKNFDAYANKNCFQFIIDFCEDHEFKDLSIKERVILSAFLTCLSRNTKLSENNLYNLIFNFDGATRADKIVSYSFYNKFTTDLTDMLKENPERFSFIKQKALALTEQGNHVIFRTQITVDEIKCIKNSRNTYESFMTKLYMIGVSKARRITKLNTFNICEYSRDNRNIGRTRKHIQEFADLYGLELSFGQHKREISFKKISNKPVKTVEVISDELDKEEESQDMIILDQYKDDSTLMVLSDDAHINVNLINEYNTDKMSENHEPIPPEYRQIYLKYINAIQKGINTNKDIHAVLEGKFINGSDGLDRKNKALSDIFRIQSKVFKSLEELYDSDYACYSEIMDRLRSIKLLQFETGIKR